MSDIFISYSRRDIAFARVLTDAVEKRGVQPWIDWQDIPPTADWMEEIRRAIEASDAFAFIASEHSLNSKVCLEEIEHAVKHNKRLIPIVVGGVIPDQVPEAVAAVNWIIFGTEDEHERKFDDLVTAVRTDLEWVQFHTRLLVRALEWERHSQGRSYLLRGDDLKLAEETLARHTGTDPVPTPLQREYVLAGRRDAARQQRLLLSGVTIGLVIALLLGLVAWWQRGEARDAQVAANISESTAVAEAHLRATAQAEAQDEARVRATAQAVAERQSRISLSRQLAAQASSLLDSQLDLALLLSVEASNVENTAEARSSLLAALQHTPRLVTYLRPSPNNDIAFSPDGNLLVMGICSDFDVYDRNCFEVSVTLWDVADPFSPQQMETVIFNVRGDVSDFAFSPDGGTLAIAYCGDTIFGGYCDQSAVRLLDVASWRLIGDALSGPRGFINALAFSPDGDLLAAGGAADVEGRFPKSGALILWDVSDPSRPRQLGTPLTGHPYPISSIVFDPTGGILVSGSGGDLNPDNEYPRAGEIRLWDILDPTAPVLIGEPISGHTAQVTSVEVTSDGQMLVSGSADDTVIPWDISEPASPVALGDPMPHSGSVDMILLVDDDQSLLVHTHGGILTKWNIADRQNPTQIDTVTVDLFGGQYAAFAPDGDKLALSNRQVVALLDISEDDSLSLPMSLGVRVRGEYYDYNESLDLIRFSPDGDRLAVVGEYPPYIELWDVSVPSAPVLIDLPSKTSVTFGPDGRAMAISYDGDATRLLDISDPLAPVALDLPFPYESYLDVPRAIHFGQSQVLLASAQHTGLTLTLTLSDISDPGASRKPGVSASVRVENWDNATVQWSPDGRTVAWHSHMSVVQKGFLALWDVADATSLVPLGEPIELDITLSTVVFSPNGELLIVSGCADFGGQFCVGSKSQLWKLRPSPTLLALFPFRSYSVAFDPDGTTLVTTGGIYDISIPESPVQIGPSFLGGDAICSDGRTVVTIAHSDIYLTDISDPQASTRANTPLRNARGLIVDCSPDSKWIASAGTWGPVILWNIDQDSWRNHACRIANRNLTQTEWVGYVGAEPYRKTCPDLPGPLE